MQRFVSFIPAVLVAIIITVISSLYLNARNEIKDLSLSITSLKEALHNKEAQLLQKADKIIELKDKEVALMDSFKDHPRINQSLVNKPSEEKNQIENQTDSQGESQLNQINSNLVNSKINAISKFMTLDENQKLRLKNKFIAELDPRNSNSESLGDIIGKENADFYKEQRKNTFEKVLQESIEKEILFVSNKLALDAAQENDFRIIYRNIENQIKLNRENLNKSNQSKLSTLEKLILEEKERNRLLVDAVKNILSEAQYQEFLKHQSGNQDMQIWHE